MQSLDDSILQFQQNAGRGKGNSGKQNLIFGEDRGRYIKPKLPTGEVKRLAVDATMRAAAPFQKARRARGLETGNIKPVYIEKSDMRSKILARKAGALVIFAPDASGSMALNRMNSAKGAALALLEQSYQSRDQVSIIPIRGDFADVLLPPTKSITQAKNRLDTLPCGGGTPLAHALSQCLRTGINAMSSGDTGKVMVVLLTDGRANVPLSKSLDEPVEEGAEKMTKAMVKEEVLDMARKLGAAGLNLLVIDTENKFISTGVAKEIADAAGGKYYYLPNADERVVASATMEALADLKSG